MGNDAMYARFMMSLRCAARSSQANDSLLLRPLPAKESQDAQMSAHVVTSLMYNPLLRSCISSVTRIPPPPITFLSPNPAPRSILPQTRPHIRPTPLLELLGILPPHPRRLHVGGALVVGTAQHADDAEQDGLRGLDGGPALGGVLVAVGVVFRAVKDGDADFA